MKEQEFKDWVKAELERIGGISDALERQRQMDELDRSKPGLLARVSCRHEPTSGYSRISWINGELWAYKGGLG